MRFLAFLAFLFCSVVAAAQTVPIPPQNGGTGQTNTMVWDARNFGVVCDGTTDNASDLNSAISYINSHNGGILMLPAGTCMVGSTIVMYSNVTLQGQGRSATIIEALSTMSAADSLIQTYDFSSLQGTNSTSGSYDFAIKDLTLNGNNTARGSGNGDDLDIYGFKYILENVRMILAPNFGFWSQWATDPSPPVTDIEVEAHIDDIDVNNNDNAGILFQGPHDSIIENSTTWSNEAYGIYLQDTTYAMSSGTWLVNFHAYANADTGIYINTSSIMGVDIESESQTGSSADGIDVISGSLVASNVIAFANPHDGILLNNNNTNVVDGTNIAGLTSYSNSFDGIAILADQGAQVPTMNLSSVLSNENGNGGLDTCTSGYAGNYLNVNGFSAYDNAGDGIDICMNFAIFNNIDVTNNGEYGVWFGTTAAESGYNVVTGLAGANANTDIAMGSNLGPHITIQIQDYSTTGATCQSGTVPASSGEYVQISCGGVGTNTSINDVAVAPNTN